MKTRAIITIVIGKDHQVLYAYTKQRLQEYAKQVRADLIVLESTTYDPPHFAKFEAIKILRDRGYAQSMYIDCDVYIRRGAPSIFARYDAAAFSELPHPRMEWLNQSTDWIRENLVADWPADRYYNTGVMVFDTPAIHAVADAVADATPQPGMFFEQDQLNVLMREAGFPRQNLDRCWNQFCGHRWLTPELAHDAYFLHGNALGRGLEKAQQFRKIIREYP